MTYIITEDRNYKPYYWQPPAYGFDVKEVESGQSYWAVVKPPKGRAWNIPTMRETVFREIFSPNYNGYPSLFVGDGYALCYDCGITSLASADDDSAELQHYVEWSHADQLSGMTCDACESWIYEPHCGNCGRNESEVIERCKGLLYNSSGDRCICRECIVEGIERSKRIGIADKRMGIYVDVLTLGVYDVSGIWCSGIYGDGKAVYDYLEAVRRGREQ